MKSSLFGRFVPIFFFILSIFFFREYYFSKRVPLPFNLLVSLYSPWKYQTWSEYPLGVQNKPLGYDNLKLFYPYRKFTTDEFKQGRVPLWNPNVFSGNVHAATYQSAVWYPLNLLYFVLPQADAWSILIIIQPILVGWFTYLFLRSLGQTKAAGFLGAIGFAFSGWMIALWQEVLVLVHSVLWLPLGLYASNLIWAGKYQKRGFLLLVISLSFSILAGFLQTTIYLFISIILWNIYRYATTNKQSRSQSVGLIAIGIISGFLTGAIQLVPAIESYMLSSRGIVNAKFLFDQFLSPVKHLITFIIPDFWGNPGSYNYFSSLIYIQERVIYIGIFVLIFALFMYFKKTPRDINFWKIYTAVTLSLGFAIPTSWIWYAFHVPILSAAQPARIFVLSTFGICILAGYGFDQIRSPQSLKIIQKIVIFIAGVVGIIWLFTGGVWLFVQQKSNILAYCSQIINPICSYAVYWYGQKSPYLYATISLRNLILPTLLLAVSWITFRKFWNYKKLFMIIIFGTTLLGSLYFARKIMYFSDRKFEYPFSEPITTLKELAGHYRVWSYGNGYIMRNMLSFYNIYSPEGYDALYPQRYGELLYTISTKGHLTNQINRTDVTLGQTGPNELMSNNSQRLRLMSLLGVKYILEHKDDIDKNIDTVNNRFLPELFTLAWENDEWRIWEYTKVLPRAFLVHSYQKESQPNKIVETLLNTGVDLRKTILLEEDIEMSIGMPTSSPSELSGVGSVEISSYLPDEVILAVDAREPGMVFLSDTFYPGWEAYVDGIKTTVYRANYAFRAVPVNQGQHVVTFMYRPASFFLGVALSSAGVLIIPTFLMYLFLRNRGHKGTI